MKKLLFALVVFCDCYASFVVIGGDSQDGSGSSDNPSYPLTEGFVLGETAVTQLVAPSNGLQGIIVSVAVDPLRGTVAYVGHYYDGVPTHSNALMYIGSVVSPLIEPISFPIAHPYQEFYATAIDSTGTVIAGGYDQDSYEPVVYTLPFSSNTPIAIRVPHGDLGYISAIGIGQDNRSILAGSNLSSAGPLIYVLPQGASEIVRVALPDESILGTLNAIAIAPDGTAFIVGSNDTENKPLIYKLAQGSLVAEEVSIIDSPVGGSLSSVAIDSSGNVLSVGDIYYSRTRTPLIYKMTAQSNTATLVANPNNHNGNLNSVAFGPGGIATMGGKDDDTNLPSIFRFNIHNEVFTSITFPSANPGTVFSVAVSDTGVAIIGGSYHNDNHLLLLTVNPNETFASNISSIPLRGTDDVNQLAVYNCDGSYDIRRLRPYYYLQLRNTQSNLTQSGL